MLIRKRSTLDSAFRLSNIEIRKRRCEGEQSGKHGPIGGLHDRDIVRSNVYMPVLYQLRVWIRKRREDDH